MDYITFEVENSEIRLLNIGELYAVLEQVHDKRQEKGKRYTIGILLIVTTLAKPPSFAPGEGLGSRWSIPRVEEQVDR